MEASTDNGVFNRETSLLVVIAGPAGTGKSTLCERLVSEKNGVQRVITSTTRTPRTGEENGRDYFFFNDHEFDRLVNEGEFLEWARVHGAERRYGTLRKPIEENLAAGTDLVMNVDVQGVASIQEVAKNEPALARSLVTIFLMPRSLDELRERLRGRAQDDDAEIERRMETAISEMKEWERFDFCITSGTREEDWSALDAIFTAEKRRVRRLRP